MMSHKGGADPAATIGMLRMHTDCYLAFGWDNFEGTVSILWDVVLHNFCKDSPHHEECLPEDALFLLALSCTLIPLTSQILQHMNQIVFFPCLKSLVVPPGNN